MARRSSARVMKAFEGRDLAGASLAAPSAPAGCLGEAQARVKAGCNQTAGLRELMSRRRLSKWRPRMKKSHGARLFAATILCVTGGAGFPAIAADATHPTVVELFQSQGCSSCPPANANVIALSDRPDLLTLSFGVTYWDQLGWKDTFASPQFTARQRDYARALHHTEVFTPQVIVNGRADVVGQDRHELEALIAKEENMPRRASSHHPGRLCRDRLGDGKRRRLAGPLRSKYRDGCDRARRERRPHSASQERRERTRQTRRLVGSASRFSDSGGCESGAANRRAGSELADRRDPFGRAEVDTN